MFLASKFHRGPEDDLIFFKYAMVEVTKIQGSIVLFQELSSIQGLMSENRLYLTTDSCKNVFAKKDFNLKIVNYI